MSARDRLSDEAIEAFLSAHPGWARAGEGQGALARTFRFPDYPSGIAFVVRLAFAAEARNHHPDLVVGWGRVEVRWSTHDAGGITALDTELADRTDALSR